MAQSSLSPTREDAALWYSILIGPLAWATDELLSYSLVQHACSTGHFYVLHVISLIAIAIAASGALVAWRSHHSLPREANDEGGSAVDRAHFMALVGIAASISFVIVIIALAVPRFILSPCD